VPRVDYDRIAALYDERLRDHEVDRDLVDLLERRPSAASVPVRALDIGCGTGKQVTVNRERLIDVRFVGLDRSAAMLRIARSRCAEATWVRADGARLPFVASSFDYACSQFSYHHIARTRRLIAEAFRVLRPHGRFSMTNIDPWAMRGWLVYRYFPEAFEADERDFQTVDDFVSQMRQAGFEDVRVRRADLSKTERLGAFLAYASARHRASQLMTISDAAYAAGLRCLEHAVAREGDVEVVSPFVLVTITGDKPAPSGAR